MSPGTPQTAYPTSHTQTQRTSQLYAKLQLKARRQVTVKSLGENKNHNFALGLGSSVDRSHVGVVLKRALPECDERSAAKNL